MQNSRLAHGQSQEDSLHRPTVQITGAAAENEKKAFGLLRGRLCQPAWERLRDLAGQVAALVRPLGRHIVHTLNHHDVPLCAHVSGSDDYGMEGGCRWGDVGTLLLNNRSSQGSGRRWENALDS